jgi:hypothetical protein
MAKRAPQLEMQPEQARSSFPIAPAAAFSVPFGTSYLRMSSEMRLWEYSMTQLPGQLKDLMSVCLPSAA